MFTQISAQKNSRGQKVNHNIEAKDNKNTTMKADAVQEEDHHTQK